MSFKKKLGGAVLASLVAAALFVTFNSKKWDGSPTPVGTVSEYANDISIEDMARMFHMEQPDALIDTSNLSQLPRDIVQVPLLKQVLTEDFVTYYEGHPTRMSIEGLIKRFAYENDLDFTSSLVKQVLNEPARVMLWRGPHQNIRYWAISMERGSLAQVLTMLGKSIPSDKQLLVAGELDGQPVYMLAISRYRELLLVAKGNRMVILSDAGMLFNRNRELISDRASVVRAWLDTSETRRNGVVKRFDLDGQVPIKTGHRIVVDSAVLAFNYQRFFPSYQALRFDLNMATPEPTWDTSVLYQPQAHPPVSGGASLWSQVPINPGMCASLPIAWDQVESFAKNLALTQAPPSFMPDAFVESAGVCWYEQSSLRTPLFVVQLKAGADRALVQAQIEKYFHTMINSDHDLGVSHASSSDLDLWVAPVMSEFGLNRGTGAAIPDMSFSPPLSSSLSKLKTSRYFLVSMALTNNTLFFSPDLSLVSTAININKQYQPSLADQLTAQPSGHAIVVINPKSAAELLGREAKNAVSANQDLALVIENRLQPRLDALSQFPRVSLLIKGELPTERQWVPVEWQMEKR